MTNRRTFVGAVAGGLLALPGVAPAQVARKVWRVGFLAAASRQFLVDTGYYAAFLQGMREQGYVEGQNLAIEARFADGKYERLPALAAELVRLKVDAIVAVPSPAIRAAQQATTTIPIVFPSTGDPVGSGFAASLAHPGGNITGLSNTNLDASPKLLEMLIAVVPGIARVVVLANPGSSTERAILNNVDAAARKSGIQILTIEVRTPGEIEKGFAVMKREHVDAFVIAGDSFLNMQGPQIAELAVKFRMPSVGTRPSYAKGNGLMSYGQEVTDNYRRAATYVDRILKGAKPGDLPIEQATRFEMVVNIRTAKALGLTIPQSLLARADVVIR
jgi:putative ABC transport system substrate-binding protein